MVEFGIDKLSQKNTNLQADVGTYARPNSDDAMFYHAIIQETSMRYNRIRNLQFLQTDSEEYIYQFAEVFRTLCEDDIVVYSFLEEAIHIFQF